MEDALGAVRSVEADAGVMAQASTDHDSEEPRRTRSCVRVELPYHLRTLARVGSEVELEIVGLVTQRTVLDALEARYPMLRGTIRDYHTDRRRPFLRFFACEHDLSHDSPDRPLPDAVAAGKEPFLVIGSLSGG